MYSKVQCYSLKSKHLEMATQRSRDQCDLHLIMHKNNHKHQAEIVLQARKVNKICVMDIDFSYALLHWEKYGEKLVCYQN